MPDLLVTHEGHVGGLRDSRLFDAGDLVEGLRGDGGVGETKAWGWIGERIELFTVF